MIFTLSLTHDCNLGCTYCYSGEKSRRAMSWEVAKASLDFGFGQIRPDDHFQLGFFGGEPLLEWDLLVKSTEYAEKLSEEKGVELRKTVTTNGTLLTPEKVTWLKENDFYPAFSMDGNRAMHDATRPLIGGKSSFDQTVKGLRHLLVDFPDAEVIVVIDPSNIEHLYDSVVFLSEEEDVKRIAINPNFYTEWPDDKLEIWE